MATTVFRPHPNNVSATLATAHASGSGSLVLASGTGAAFGSTFPMTVTVAQAANVGTTAEVNTIFTVTGRTSDTLTGATATEGTTDRAYAIGDRVEARWTSGLASTIEGAVNALETTVTTTALPGQILINQGTQTANNPAVATSATWNNSSIFFFHWYCSVTDTASSLTSLLQLMQVGGVNKWAVDKTGKITVGSADAALLTSGVAAPARLGTGSPTTACWLRGDGAWMPFFTIQNVSGNTTLSGAANNWIVADATSGPITITLPAGSTMGGSELIIQKKDVSANAVTIQRAGTDVFLVGSSTSLTLSSQGKFVRLISGGGSIWFTVGSN